MTDEQKSELFKQQRVLTVYAGALKISYQKSHYNRAADGTLNEDVSDISCLVAELLTRVVAWEHEACTALQDDTVHNVFKRTWLCAQRNQPHAFVCGVLAQGMFQTHAPKNGSTTSAPHNTGEMCAIVFR